MPTLALLLGLLAMHGLGGHLAGAHDRHDLPGMPMATDSLLVEAVGVTGELPLSPPATTAVCLAVLLVAGALLVLRARRLGPGALAPSRRRTTPAERPAPARGPPGDLLLRLCVLRT